MMHQTWCLLRSIAVAAAATVLAVLPGSNIAMPQTDTVRCAIVAEVQGRSVIIRAVITADGPVAGRYRLRAVMSGPGNHSSVSQGGGFTAAPAMPATVGTLALAGDGGAKAMLDVIWRGQTVSCAWRSPGAH